MNFPVKNLELKDFIPLPGGGADGDKKDPSAPPLRSKFDLIANIVHDGKPGEGSYRVYVQRKSEETWYGTVQYSTLQYGYFTCTGLHSYAVLLLRARCSRFPCLLNLQEASREVPPKSCAYCATIQIDEVTVCLRHALVCAGTSCRTCTE